MKNLTTILFQFMFDCSNLFAVDRHTRSFSTTTRFSSDSPRQTPKAVAQNYYYKLLERYVRKNVEKLENHFEKLSPQNYKRYTMFKTGYRFSPKLQVHIINLIIFISLTVSGIYKYYEDTKRYISVVKNLSAKKLEDFSSVELDSYREVLSFNQLL